MRKRTAALRRKKRIAVVGGGTGVFTVLTGLKGSGHHLTAIVTMADDGGSTGFLREEFGILPPGDIRRALVALSGAERRLSDLFTYRFEKGKGLKGHSVGNLLLTALERMTGSFERAVEEAGRILRIEGDVVPVTLDRVRLKAWLDGGRVVFGEHAIDVPFGRRIARIARIALIPKARANPKALDAIARADLIVLGPGDLFTSILPNLVVGGISRAIRKSRAKKIYVVNVMTKQGETDGFTAREFVHAIEERIGKNVLNAVVVNTELPTQFLLRWYRKNAKSDPVRWTRAMFSGSLFRVIGRPLLRQEGNLIRHDPQKLARVLLAALKKR